MNISLQNIIYHSQCVKGLLEADIFCSSLTQKT